MTIKMSSLYSPVSISFHVLCGLCFVVLTIYSKDQVIADLWLLQRSVQYVLLSIMGFCEDFFFLGIERKVLTFIVTGMIRIGWSL